MIFIAFIAKVVHIAMDQPQGSKIHYFLNSLFTNQYKMETVGNRWQPSRWLEYNRCSQPSTPCLPTKTELQLLQPAHFRLRWTPPTEIFYILYTMEREPWEQLAALGATRVPSLGERSPTRPMNLPLPPTEPTK